MNKQQRKDLQLAVSAIEKAKELLSEAKEIIERCGEDEQEKFDNLSEGLQATEANQLLEENASTLSDIASDVDTIMDDCDERINSINEL